MAPSRHPWGSNGSLWVHGAHCRPPKGSDMFQPAARRPPSAAHLASVQSQEKPLSGGQRNLRRPRRLLSWREKILSGSEKPLPGPEKRFSGPEPLSGPEMPLSGPERPERPDERPQRPLAREVARRPPGGRTTDFKKCLGFSLSCTSTSCKFRI